MELITGVIGAVSITEKGKLQIHFKKALLRPLKYDIDAKL
jgi:hypothetical protein